MKTHAKRIFSVLLCLCMLLSMTPIGLAAHSHEVHEQVSAEDRTPVITSITLSGRAVTFDETLRRYTITIPSNQNSVELVMRISGENLDKISAYDWIVDVGSANCVVLKPNQTVYSAIVDTRAISPYSHPLRYTDGTVEIMPDPFMGPAMMSKYYETGYSVLVQSGEPSPEPLFIEAQGLDSDDNSFGTVQKGTYIWPSGNAAPSGDYWTDTGRGNLLFNFGYTPLGSEGDRMVLGICDTEYLESAAGNYSTYVNIKEHREYMDDLHRAMFDPVEVYENGLLGTEHEDYDVVAVSPIIEENGATVLATAELFEAQLPMPCVFTQVESFEPAFLSDYMYQYAGSLVEDGEVWLDFRHIPATLRFAIKNPRESELMLSSVKVRLADEAGTIAYPVAAEMVTMSMDEGYWPDLSYTGEYTEITTNTETTLKSGEIYVAYALALPLADQSAFEGKKLQIVIDDGEHSFVAMEVDGDEIADVNYEYYEYFYNWNGGCSYTFHMEARCFGDCTFDTNGLCSVCGAKAEASVSTPYAGGIVGSTKTYYATLDQAVQAVADCTAADRAVLTIQRNIDLGNAAQKIASGTFTMDLNGFSIKSSACVLNIEGGNVTIRDSDLTQGGVIDGNCAINAKNCNLTINGGNICGTEWDLQVDKAEICLTLGENGEGATFPGGIRVSGTTLNALLADRMAYWQGETKIICADDQTELEGDVTVKKACNHANGIKENYVAGYTEHSYTYSCCGEEYFEAHKFEGAVCTDCGAVRYDIWVAETQVMSSNAHDVLGDGTIRFDADTCTLTLNGASVDTSELGIPAVKIISGDVKLVLQGDNSLIASDKHEPEHDDATDTFYGYAAIEIAEGASVSIDGSDDASLSLQGNAFGYTAMDHIAVLAAVSGGGELSICGGKITTGGILLDGDYIQTGGDVNTNYISAKNVSVSDGILFANGNSGIIYMDPNGGGCFGICTSENIQIFGGTVNAVGNGLASSSDFSGILRLGAYGSDVLPDGLRAGVKITVKGGTVTACGSATGYRIDDMGNAAMGGFGEPDGLNGYAIDAPSHSISENATFICGTENSHLYNAATCQSPAICDFCRASTGEKNPDHHDEAVAYVNGICPNGCYEPATLSGNVYEIGNAGQLYWFAEKVNGGDRAANAILTGDIDLGGREWTPIASTALYYKTTSYSDKGYEGIFDGQGHVISGMHVTTSATVEQTYGLFGTLSGTVKNLGMTGVSYTFPNDAKDLRAGGIVGQMLNGSRVENCYVTDSSITPGQYIVGGIAACNYAGTIEHCFTRNVAASGNERCGNLVSDIRGDISATDRPGEVINCYTDAQRVHGTQKCDSVPAVDCQANVDAARFASGEIAYLLGDAFGQSIGADALPVLGGEKVYYAYLSCADSEKTYTNDANATPTKPTHSWTDATCIAPKTCSVCGATEGSTGPHTALSYTDCGQTHTFDCTLCGEAVTEAHNYADYVCACGNISSEAEATVTMNAITTGYLHWYQAFSAVETATEEDEAVVTLRKDIDLGENSAYINHGTFTLDLNDCTITSSHTYKTIEVNLPDSNVLTVVDNGATGIGSIENTGPLQTAVDINSGTLNLKNGIVNSLNCSNSATLNILGGTINSKEAGVSVSGGEANIYGGTITGSSNGVNTFNGITNIYGGTITGEYYGVRASGGITNIRGGVIHSTNDVPWYGALYIVAGEMIVTGGEITGPSSDIVFSSSATGALLLTVEDGEHVGATFPGGINVYRTTLRAILAEDVNYCKGYDAVEISDGDMTIPDADVTVRKPCTEHTWLAATCTTPKTCSACGITEGEVEHAWGEDSVCVLCGAVRSIVIKLYDRYGDGWSGNAIVVYKDRELYQTFTLNSGFESTQQLEYNSESSYIFKWAAGSYASECTFTIEFGNRILVGVGSGYDIASAAHLQDGEVILALCDHAWMNADCENPKTCQKCGLTEGDVMHAWGDDSVCDLCGVCQKITVNMDDFYGDGWNGNTILVYKDAQLYQTITLNDGYEDEVSFDYDSNSSYSFKWEQGSNASDAVFTIAVEGEILYGVGSSYDIANGAVLKDGEVFFSLCDHEWVSADCEKPKTCSKCCLTEGKPVHTWGDDIFCDLCGAAAPIIVQLADQYNDGWNGNEILVYKNTVLIDTLTIAYGKTGEATIDFDPNASYRFDWKPALWYSECSFTITQADKILCSSNEIALQDAQTFFTICKHAWVDASCQAPKTCTNCGMTDGELGHIWIAATCYAPKTCSQCGETDGDVVHAWIDATCTAAKSCTLCGTTEGEPLNHAWIDATCTTPKLCSRCGAAEGEPVHVWADENADPKTCTLCGKTVCLGPDEYENGICIACGSYEPIETNDSGYYEIANAGQLFAFAELVNSGTNCAANAVLTADIDMAGLAWIPIGNANQNFEGVFDGAGHKVINLSLATDVNLATNYDRIGLIANMAGGGVKNLTVEGEITHNYWNALSYAGLIVAQMTDSIVYNCAAYGTIRVDSTACESQLQAFVGGAIGGAYHSVVMNCATDVYISVGGDESVPNAYIGGIIGKMEALEPECILNSYALGDITVDAQGSSSCTVGGLVGSIYDDASNNYYAGTIDMNNNINYGYIFYQISSGNTTFIIENNYHPAGTNPFAVGSSSYSSGMISYTPQQLGATEGDDALVNMLNANIADVLSIVAGHRGYLNKSEWADIVEKVDGQSVTVLHWTVKDGHPVFCMELACGETCSECGFTMPGIGWQQIGGEWYYIDPESNTKATGLARVPYPDTAINGVTYAPDQEALEYYEAKGESFIDATAGYFYFDANGVFQADFTGINFGSYLENGFMVWNTGLIEIDGEYYYFIGDEYMGGNCAAFGNYHVGENNTDRNITIGGVYTFDENGKLCEYDGITDSKNALWYYEDAQLMLGKGLIAKNGNFYYVRSNGALVVSQSYWVEKTNGYKVVVGEYEFDADGKLIFPKSTDKHGIYFERGGWYYYENGKIARSKGLLNTSLHWFDEDGYDIWSEGAIIYVRSDGRLATGRYYISNVKNFDGTIDAKVGMALSFDSIGRMIMPKNGIYMVDGIWRYFINDVMQYNSGVVVVDNQYYYVRSNGVVVSNCSYWITNVGSSGVIAGEYYFDECGVMHEPKFEGEAVLNGIADGYYYEDGKIAYNKGLTYLEAEDCYVYVRSNGKIATGKYWITNHNNLLPAGCYDFGSDGKLYMA